MVKRTQVQSGPRFPGQLVTISGGGGEVENMRSGFDPTPKVGRKREKGKKGERGVLLL